MSDFIVYRVKGNSMWPFLRDKDTVLVRPSRLKEISLGQIILAKKDNLFLCHRLFRKRKEFFQTKADSLFGLDCVLEEKYLLGKVVAIERKGRLIKVDKRVDLYWGFFILCFTLLISPLFPFVRKIRRILRYVVGREAKPGTFWGSRN